jgi:hypothetical protein
MPKELIGSHEINPDQETKAQLENELEHLKEYISNIQKIKDQMTLYLSREKMEKWNEAAQDTIADLSEKRKKLENDLEALR